MLGKLSGENHHIPSLWARNGSRLLSLILPLRVNSGTGSGFRGVDLFKS
jgi:hypothetical protein